MKFAIKNKQRLTLTSVNLVDWRRLEPWHLIFPSLVVVELIGKLTSDTSEISLTEHSSCISLNFSSCFWSKEACLSKLLLLLQLWWSSGLFICLKLFCNCISFFANSSISSSSIEFPLSPSRIFFFPYIHWSIISPIIRYNNNNNKQEKFRVNCSDWESFSIKWQFCKYKFGKS